VELCDYLINGLRTNKSVSSQSDEDNLVTKQNNKSTDINNNNSKSNSTQNDKFTHYTYTFGLVEILKALNLLDSRRKIRALEKKLQRMEREKTAKGPTIGKVKGTINDLKQDPVHVGSVSGSLAKFIKRWVSTIPKEALEFFSLTYPKEPWRVSLFT
jgi:hypothetical protein